MQIFDYIYLKDQYLTTIKTGRYVQGTYRSFEVVDYKNYNYNTIKISQKLKNMIN